MTIWSTVLEIWSIVLECDRLKLAIICHFLPFYPPPQKNPPEKSLFWKNEKKLLKISSFYTCVTKTTIIWSTVLWDTEWDRQKFLLLWAIFCYSTCLTTWKIKILKTWKKHLEMSSFYTFVTKTTIIWSTVRQKFLSLRAIFCYSTHITTWKIKISKK